jgi:diguanylate cyclase (GGDEF)-like protein
VSQTVSPVLDAGGRDVGASAIARDISERKRLEGQLQYLAEHDPLTGMYNRWRFERELTRELAVARRYGGGGALLAIDLDHFKFVNDSLGHVAGDELIRRSAAVVRSRMRDTDILARMGGDEFAVILRASGPGEAESVAADLVSALREEVQLEMAAGVQRITASVGIAPFPGPEPLSAEDLLVEADIAMYDAKEAGRDCARLYDAGQQRHRLMHARLTWVERIRRALADERFVLHAQPIVALEGGGPARYELLLRMIGDDGELVPPGTFLEVAERFELIQAIDRWVLTQGCALLAERQRCGDDVRLAINVSAKSATDPGMAAAIATELAGAGARADGLCIELTETDAIINVDRAKEFALQLGKLGCEFALDDFGAGFASFYYLKHLAYDLLKIDGEFVSGLSDTHANRLIVEAIVGIARGMGRRTVAECVADAETLESLRGTGVDFVQGYHLAEPAPLERFGLVAATH